MVRASVAVTSSFRRPPHCSSRDHRRIRDVGNVTYLESQALKPSQAIFQAS